ncbi:MAG: formylglycine-generating enzyme family protein [bacterium]
MRRIYRVVALLLLASFLVISCSIDPERVERQVVENIKAARLITIIEAGRKRTIADPVVIKYLVSIILKDRERGGPRVFCKCFEGWEYDKRNWPRVEFETPGGAREILWMPKGDCQIWPARLPVGWSANFVNVIFLGKNMRIRKSVNTRLDLEKIRRKIQKVADRKKQATHKIPIEKFPAVTTNKKDDSELILIPAGKFIMGSHEGRGSSDEFPLHRVYLPAYYIGKYEVTNKQFALFVKETGYQAEGDWKQYYNLRTREHPVIGVSWKDAMEYCHWAGLRLPTEAEWEKAARDKDEMPYPWGNRPSPLGSIGRPCNSRNGPKLSGMANLWEGHGTLPVGSCPSGASPYGCLDMAGNVWEWCADWYDENYYKNSPYINPQGPENGFCRVLRGGSWCDNYDYTDYDPFRCANRSGFIPGSWGNDNGFRAACDLNIP